MFYDIGVVFPLSVTMGGGGEGTGVGESVHANVFKVH